jgi:hypothetical protein
LYSIAVVPTPHELWLACSILLGSFLKGTMNRYVLWWYALYVAHTPKVPFAYRIYKSQHELAAKFKETFSKSVEIEMLGVWSVALIDVLDIDR